VQVTIPKIKGIRWRYCERWDEEPAAKLGISLLRVGICAPEDWTGSAVDFVERGFKRLAQVNGIDIVRKVWEGDIRILDHMFELSEQERHQVRAEMDDPAQSLFLVSDFSSAASIPIGATLDALEREHPRLPAAFFVAFRHCLGKWMLVYDYDAASEHAEMLMLEREPGELVDSVYPKVAPSLPSCLRDRLSMNPRFACSILQATQSKLGASTARELVSHLLEMWKHSTGYSHYWPSRLVREIRGLDDYLEECDGIGPGCLLNWYEDDPISACFDEEVEYIGQNGPLAPCILRMITLDRPKEKLDQQVGELFEYVAAMIRSLACAAKIVEIIRELYDEHLRQHRLEPGLQALPSTPGLRDE
jgi:hypothetical protein